MNIEEFREHCLSLGDVSEKMPFGKFAARYDSILAFYVCGHMFCFVDTNDFTYVNLKADPLKIEELSIHREAVSAPLNQSMQHWVEIAFDKDISDSEILDMVREAFGIVRDKYTKIKPRKKGVKKEEE